MERVAVDPKDAPPPPEDTTSAKNIVGAAVEPAVAMATGAVATPVAGIAGMAQHAANELGLSKREPGEVVRSTQQALTYEPRTQGGKTATEVIGYPFEKLGEVAKGAGDYVLDKTGSPGLATLVHTILEAAPQLLGAKGVGELAERVPGIPREAAPALTKEQAALKDVRDMGYKVSPTQARPSVINNLLEGWAGPAGAAKEMSLKNQPVTNEKIKSGLGIPKTSDLDYKAIDEVIAREGQAYEAVRNVPVQIKVDKQFIDAADTLFGSEKQAAQRWPQIFKLPEVQNLRENLLKAHNSTPTEVVDLVRRLRHDASLLLKSKDDPNKAAIGFAYRRGAEALDGLLDRRLEESGYRNLVRDYRKSRKTIAQAYDVRSATNDFTGNVDAVHLAKLGEKRPFTDFMKDVANAASVSKKTMRTPEQVGGHPGMSSLEGSIAAAEMVGGKVPTGSAFLLRPLIAKAIASEPYQKAFVDRAGGPKSNLTKRILELATATGGGQDATDDQR